MDILFLKLLPRFDDHMHFRSRRDQNNFGPAVCRLGQHGQLAIHYDVMPGRIVPRDVMERLLFVVIDQHQARDRFPGPWSLNYAQTENQIIIEENNYRAPREQKKLNRVG